MEILARPFESIRSERKPGDRSRRDDQRYLRYHEKRSQGDLDRAMFRGKI